MSDFGGCEIVEPKESESVLEVFFQLLLDPGLVLL